jgi:hypothetical protein
MAQGRLQAIGLMVHQGQFAMAMSTIHWCTSTKIFKHDAPTILLADGPAELFSPGSLVAAIMVSAPRPTY